MRKSILSLLLGLATFELAAQNIKKITYLSEVTFGSESITALLKEGSTDEGEDSMLYNEMKMQFGLFFDSVAKQQSKNTLEAWRDGDWVTTREMNSAEGKIAKHYHVKTLQFNVIDSFSFRRLNKIDTFKSSLDFKKHPTWNVKYTVTKKKDKKRILEYNCSLLEIKETKTIRTEEPEERVISVWVTKKIKPAISTHALLGLYSKVLQNYTPLQVISFSNKMPGASHSLIAISIK